MKRRYLLPLICLAVVFTSFKPSPPAAAPAQIKWMTWQEVQEAQKVQPRKVFIDVYTDWCGWCKRMDSTTFVNQEIVKHINENYYAIKFNAEAKEVIKFKGKEYKFVPQGFRGYHELAAEILTGQMSYPTSVYMDEELRPLFPVPGYLDAKKLEQVLNYVSGNNYKSMAFDQFALKFQGKVQ